MNQNDADALQVRFELKTDKGSFMVSLEPPPEELLFPEPVSRAEFRRVQGSLGALDRDSVDCQVGKSRKYGWPMVYAGRYQARAIDSVCPVGPAVLVIFYFATDPSRRHIESSITRSPSSECGGGGE